MTVQSSVLTVGDAIADRLGLLRRRLRAEHLLRTARQGAGFDDLGDATCLDSLQRLLDALAAEASLSVVGHLTARWDALRFLSNLLRLQAEEAHTPAILAQHVDRPVFITGLPRSGTTFLHRLLLLDPGNRAPLVWQTIYPYPLTDDIDRRVGQVARQLRMFEWLAPEFRGLHPLSATSPQECSEITAHVFRSLRFDTTYDIPSYRTWLDATGHVPAYQFHKRFLQHLQQQGTAARQPLQRWVLKCPDHVFALSAIRDVYPDARLVFVHRDPVSVLLSVARLTQVLRAPFTRRLDPLAIGRQESARWLQGAQLMMEAARAPQGESPICHVHYLDLITDPLTTVAGVYRHFGLHLADTIAARMQQEVGRTQNGGYAPHAYRFEDHGLQADRERAKFRAYMVQFGIQPEGPPRTAVPARVPGVLTPTPTHAGTRTP